MKKQIDIENLLIWAFQTECASLHDDFLDVTAGYPEDSTVRCERCNVLGGFITGTGPGARVLASSSASDAVTITDAMAPLDPWVRRLVASHAKAGTRPEWGKYARHRFDPRDWVTEPSGESYGNSEIVPTYERIDHLGRENWKPRKERDPSTGKLHAVPAPRWVPVVEKDRPEQVRSLRDRYVAWWRALRNIGEQVRTSLGEWELSPLMPDPSPWNATHEIAA